MEGLVADAQVSVPAWRVDPSGGFTEYRIERWSSR